MPSTLDADELDLSGVVKDWQLDQVELDLTGVLEDGSVMSPTDPVQEPGPEVKRPRGVKREHAPRPKGRPVGPVKVLENCANQLKEVVKEGFSETLKHLDKEERPRKANKVVDEVVKVLLAAAGREDDLPALAAQLAKRIPSTAEETAILRDLGKAFALAYEDGNLAERRYLLQFVPDRYTVRDLLELGFESLGEDGRVRNNVRETKAEKGVKSYGWFQSKQEATKGGGVAYPWWTIAKADAIWESHMVYSRERTISSEPQRHLNCPPRQVMREIASCAPEVMSK